MTEYINKYSKPIALLIMILMVLFIGNIVKIHRNKAKLENINLKTSKIDREKFAIYVEDDGEYVEYDNDTFPTDGYTFNSELSNCVDVKGNIVENILSLNGNSVTVTSNKTVYCTLYFDIIPPDIKITLGENALTKPSKTINCSNGTTGTYWDSKYRGLVFGSGTNTSTNCSISGSDATSLGYLKDIVEGTTVSFGNTGVVDESSDNAGYRYEGKEPNNYIWFNDEMWRIIGSIPVCTTSGCGNSSTRLVKIIRNESIGGLVSDGKSSGNTGEWGSNTLYKLLNGCYYGKKNTSDYDLNNSGTLCSTYCNGYSSAAKVGCDYTNIGISNDASDYYGSMVENVYWNTGASTNAAAASTVYTNEKVTQTVAGRIGLMSASDYGYAASFGRGNLSAYSNVNYMGSDWLYGQGYEWTNIQSSSNTDHALNVSNSGFATGNARYGYAVRPVLYLSASVYVVSGDGSEVNPYQIAM